MFGITARDTNGFNYEFVIDTVEQVRKFASEAKRDFGTVVVRASYQNQELGFHDYATLCYGTLPWEHTGFDRVASL
jgi:hypothetical protein